MIKRTLTILGLVAISALQASGQNTKISAETISAKEPQMWDTTWQYFFCQKTSMFYDYLNSYDITERFKFFPKTEEANAVNPNPMGYGTGMENACLNADTILIGVLEKYKVTKDKSLATYASKIFDGIESCTIGHKNRGFVVRGKSPFDNKSHYPVTSRDQVTQAIHGAWKFYNSDLSNAQQKERAVEVITSIADYMIRTITPERDYNFGDYSGEVPTLERAKALTKMWEVEPHEAARLPMIYISAYKLTGKEIYKKYYDKYISEALKQTSECKPNVAFWGQFQMHLSLETIYEAETDTKIKEQVKELMKMSAKLARSRMAWATDKWINIKDKSILSPDWRDKSEKAKSDRDKFNEIWFGSEAPAYMALCMMLGNTIEIDAPAKDMILKTLAATDFKNTAAAGIAFQMSMYWRAVADKIF